LLLFSAHRDLAGCRVETMIREWSMAQLEKLRSLLDAREPAHSLPQGFYADPDVFEFDLAVIYGQNWILAGFEVELPEAGSYLALPIGRSPVVIVRGQDGALRGFHNTCRHRGAQVCETGHGHKTWLTCPYHQWSYSLDGRLSNGPRMPATLDLAQLGLRPVHVETVAGAIYVCLAEQPPLFGEFRDSIAPLLAPHDLANAKLVFESTLVERANWKLVMENARECYHCSARHPELAVTFPVRGRRSVQFADVECFERFRSRMSQVGLPVGPADGAWWQAMRFPLNDGAITLSMDGQPACTKLMCDVAGGDIGTMRWALEPHCFVHATSDVVFMFSAMPTGPQETVVTSKWLVHKDAVEGVDYDLERLTELWTTTNLQDRDLCENNQRGINSLGYLPGPYSEEAEMLVMRFVDWYCGEVREHLDRSERPDRLSTRPRLAAAGD
jgi:Rieske 2Fe-2S family protein